MAPSYREMFLLIDDARNGSVSFEHLKTKMLQLGLPKSSVNSPHFDHALSRLVTKDVEMAIGIGMGMGMRLRMGIEWG